jgi:hypothetical protein
VGETLLSRFRSTGVSGLRLCGVAVCLVMALLAAAAGSAVAATPLAWVRVGRVLPGPSAGLACPSLGLCVAVDRSGNASDSTAPQLALHSRRWPTGYQHLRRSRCYSWLAAHLRA